MWRIDQGDWLACLKAMPDESVHCVVTSPPYWGLRDYGTGIWIGGDACCQHKEKALRKGLGLAEWSEKNGRGGGHKAGAIDMMQYKGQCKKCGALRVDLQLGLEKTPQEYIAKIVAGFREVRRVLRKDGTCWVNMGDAYAGSGKGQNADGTHSNGGKQATHKGTTVGNLPSTKTTRDDGHRYGRGGHTSGVTPPNGFKPKDLVGMPWRVAFALQDDGWWLRQDIIWSKPNPMPESVLDRCTKAHEYIFLLAKSKRYFYDAYAIKEQSSLLSNPRGEGVNPKARKEGQHSRMGVDRDPRHIEYSRNKTNGVGWGYANGEPRALSPRAKQNESFSSAVTELVTERNKRSVWEIATSPFPEAHFATFPTALVEPCILAGTSEKGCCIQCGAPWMRVLKITKPASKTPSGWHQADERKEVRDANTEYNGKHSIAPDHSAGRRVLEAMKKGRAAGADHNNPFAQKESVGWKPTCKCGEPGTVPCVVYDPFNGAGTTGLVAVRMGRSYIGSELNPEYREMAIRRIEQDAPLFNLSSHVEDEEKLVLPLLPFLPQPDGTAS